MLKDHKQLCSRIAPAGWRYGGFDDGFYVFVSGDYSKGFKEMKCLEDDLTAENLEFMSQPVSHSTLTQWMIPS